ncbi:Adhesin [Hyphodiscus hymeniophilus]|uniref:Adhesin n=1 Tax=Hyphodiscus hymeniophilus TaxID=353542 RepID=A0A9P6VJR6_9HELO|nr:Adhesin [Hyphodiscus hymeniophilus]
MPTNTAPVLNPQDSGEDATWGCSPGFVCNPPKPDHCEFFENPPLANYTCEPENCIMSPPITDVHWKDDESSLYPATEGYFNLNPNDFGLSFDIFAEQLIVSRITDKQGVKTVTSTTGDWSSQASLSSFPPAETDPAVKLKPRALSLPANTVPSMCYDDCNNAFVEAQHVGKIYNSLCVSGTPFEDELSACQICVAAHGDEQKLSLQIYVYPQFAQFIGFCSAKSPQSEVSASTSPVLASAKSTEVTPTSSVQVTSQVSASSVPIIPISTGSAIHSSVILASPTFSGSSATHTEVSTSLPPSTALTSTSSSGSSSISTGLSVSLSPSVSLTSTSSSGSSAISTGVSASLPPSAALTSPTFSGSSTSTSPAQVTNPSSSTNLQPSRFILAMTAATLAFCAFLI